jgi:hypothetical protein
MKAILHFTADIPQLQFYFGENQPMKSAHNAHEQCEFCANWQTEGRAFLLGVN